MTHAIDCRWPGPLTCDLSFLQERLRSPLTDFAKFRYSRTYHTAIKIIFPMSPICGFCVSFFDVVLRFFFWRVYMFRAVIQYSFLNIHAWMPWNSCSFVLQFDVEDGHLMPLYTLGDFSETLWSHFLHFHGGHAERTTIVRTPPPSKAVIF